MTPYYADDLVTLYLGDSREATEWLAADVLVTDPPYGMDSARTPMTAYTPHARRQRQPGKYAPQEKVSIQGDASTEIRDAALTLWAGRGSAVVFGTWRLPRPESVTHRLIWHKRRTAPGPRSSAFYPAEEEIYLIGSGWTGTPIQNVIVTDELRGGAAGFVARSGHPTPKPSALMELLISKCPSGVIADPFAGAGSTLVAARNLGRRAVGVELEERYAERAARRLSQGVLLQT